MENMQVASPLPNEKSFFFYVMTQVIKMTPDAKAKAKAKEKPPSSESGLSPDQVLVLSAGEENGYRQT